mmetsp:Transcript_4300/g.7695  ORF Transcript_4300/g.7695 Transcript_4300/m.7695 type:complete len:647 (-) Transcript_4300:158-2098(-)|eukprot:CAMPEP_0198294948 /NCGR_PEP_ID=MMETSP1449-20131203/24868_1 /TAXON_ID=420275 /ORGANISM="Attheya septentrionalis, Strain CCMP2084" /LENGTH=646 /DNA_ID=CAMNT_0043995065 /DNA_START=58 /DNA_END=1998 /DNA_ORIENTATION=-
MPPFGSTKSLRTTKDDASFLDASLNGGHFHYPDRKPILVDPGTIIPPSLQLLTKNLCSLESRIFHGDYDENKNIPIRAAIANLIKEAEVKLEDLTPWIDRGHSSRDCYGRKAIFGSDTLEVMVMTWLAGDVCALHDHGSTEHGAVQIMGPVDQMHVVVQTNDSTGLLQTLNLRTNHKPGEILQVTHELCHCMGNVSHRSKKDNEHSLLTDEEDRENNYAVTMHVYWKSGKESDHVTSVTGGARVFDVVQSSVCETDAGVFHGLPKSVIMSTEERVEADFPTLLRDGTELLLRMMRMTPEQRAETDTLPISDIFQHLFAFERKEEFLRDVSAIVDAETGHKSDSTQWAILCHALRTAAPLQRMVIPGTRNTSNNSLVSEDGNQKRDSWQEYARMYDALIGNPCMDSFMGKYVKYFFDQVWLKETGRSIAEDCKVMSVGCGTGLVERFMLDEVGISPQNLAAFDLSPSMVETAVQFRGITTAKVGNVLEMSAEMYGLHDVLYAGLNVFQYLPADKLDDALERTAACTKEGGYFVTDFITPDHIRWYPNLMISADRKTFSLRTPQLIQKDYQMYQRSDIINVTWDTEDGSLKINDSGLHQRWLAPMSRIIEAIEKHFPRVRVFDAVTMEELPRHADTSPSTRYVVIANK